MSNNLRGFMDMEHRDDYTYLIVGGREFIVTDYRERPEYGYGYSKYENAWHTKIELGLMAVPAKPKLRPKKRSWARSMGLRKAVA